jgi:hypothetical protein
MESMRQRLLWISGLAALLGAAALAFRPARLLGARVTAVTPGSPPVASVALAYGPGLAPSSVIVDVLDSDGNGGSATIGGAQLFLEIPLSGALRSRRRVTATATYLLLGRPLTVVREFAA